MTGHPAVADRGSLHAGHEGLGGAQSYRAGGYRHVDRAESLDDVDLASTAERCFSTDPLRGKRDASDRRERVFYGFRDTCARSGTPPNVDIVPILPCCQNITENDPTKHFAGLEALKASQDNPWAMLIFVLVGAILADKALPVEVRTPIWRQGDLLWRPRERVTRAGVASPIPPPSGPARILAPCVHLGLLGRSRASGRRLAGPRQS